MREASVPARGHFGILPLVHNSACDESALSSHTLLNIRILSRDSEFVYILNRLLIIQFTQLFFFFFFFFSWTRSETIRRKYTSLLVVPLELLLPPSRLRWMSVRHFSTHKRVESDQHAAWTMRLRKFIVWPAWKVSSKDYRLVSCTRCRRRLFAGRPMSSSNISSIERRKWNQLWLSRRNFLYRLTTINLRSNLYTLFYRKIHQKSWTKHQAPVSIPRVPHRPFRTRANCRQCQTALFTLTQCTRTTVRITRISRTSDPTHNFISPCSSIPSTNILSFLARSRSKVESSTQIVDQVLVIWT